jgi:DMSO reductase anchor subunit
VETRRGQIIAIVVLAVLMVIAIGLLTYGMVTDNDALSILGFCIAIPVFFGLLVNLGMFFGWSGKR